MRAKDVRDMNEAELADHIETTRKDVFGLRFQHATGELENTAGLRFAKRDLARALTIKRQREIEEYNRSDDG
ncbi:MAG: 50S ribosomal protein L29 [Solirubrobacteraceae bacterium]